MVAGGLVVAFTVPAFTVTLGLGIAGGGAGLILGDSESDTVGKVWRMVIGMMNEGQQDPQGQGTGGDSDVLSIDPSPTKGTTDSVGIRKPVFYNPGNVQIENGVIVYTIDNLFLNVVNQKNDPMEIVLCGADHSLNDTNFNVWSSCTRISVANPYKFIEALPVPVQDSLKNAGLSENLAFPRIQEGYPLARFRYADTNQGLFGFSTPKFPHPTLVIPTRPDGHIALIEVASHASLNGEDAKKIPSRVEGWWNNFPKIIYDFFEGISRIFAWEGFRILHDYYSSILSTGKSIKAILDTKAKAPYANKSAFDRFIKGIYGNPAINRGGVIAQLALNRQYPAYLFNPGAVNENDFKAFADMFLENVGVFVKIPMIDWDYMYLEYLHGGHEHAEELAADWLQSAASRDALLEEEQRIVAAGRKCITETEDATKQATAYLATLELNFPAPSSTGGVPMLDGIPILTPEMSPPTFVIEEYCKTFVSQQILPFKTKAQQNLALFNAIKSELIQNLPSEISNSLQEHTKITEKIQKKSKSKSKPAPFNPRPDHNPLRSNTVKDVITEIAKIPVTDDGPDYSSFIANQSLRDNTMKVALKMFNYLLFTESALNNYDGAAAAVTASNVIQEEGYVAKNEAWIYNTYGIWSVSPGATAAQISSIDWEYFEAPEIDGGDFATLANSGVVVSILETANWEIGDPQIVVPKGIPFELVVASYAAHRFKHLQESGYISSDIIYEENEGIIFGKDSEFFRASAYFMSKHGPKKRTAEHIRTSAMQLLTDAVHVIEKIEAP